jgi:serine/threonine protein kinase/tetratricopeptide (TPR) repeat protein
MMRVTSSEVDGEWVMALNSIDIPLGPFQLTRRIGRGGMGEVWSGYHRGQGVPVAVKVVTADVARDPRYVTYFRNEVRAMAGLDHPSIVVVYDYGLVSHEAEYRSEGELNAGAPYLVMERVDGGSLHALSGRVPWIRLKHILIHLLDALAHAHARDVVHRDLKPGNVLQTAAGSGHLESIKLTDFGLAHAVVQPTGSREQRIMGTPAYMAPEQFAGKWRDYGPWTDLYSLGCVTYTLVTGHPPFGRSGNPEVLRIAHCTEPAPMLNSSIAVPEGFGEWIQRLMAKDPADRYRRAADAAWALLQLRDPSSEFRITFEDDHELSNESDSNADLLTPVLETGTQSLTWTHDDILGVGDYGSVKASMPFGIQPDAPLDESVLSPLPKTWKRPHLQPPVVRLRGAGLGLYGLRPIPLVDRMDERDSLWSALRHTREEGRPHVVLLEGPTGCGKSRLAEWLCERAHEVGAATVLCATHGRTPAPTDGLGAMVRHFMRCDRLLRANVLNRLESLVVKHGVDNSDEWNALTELVCSGTDKDWAAGQRRIHFSRPTERYVLIKRFISRLCTERPTILWFDDVQWGLDALEFAQYMMESRSKQPVPVLMVLTAGAESIANRPIEHDVLEALLERPGAKRMVVGPLAPHDRSELVQELLGLEGEVATRVEERTAGNPLFAVQLVGDWVQRGILKPGEHGFRLEEGAIVDLPDDLNDVWTDHIDRVLEGRPETDELALELAAVLGRESEATEWEETCAKEGITPSPDLIDTLLERRLARHSGDTLEQSWFFVHGMVRESIIRRAKKAGRLKAHHHACAELLRDQVGLGVDERLGKHLHAAGEFDEALAPLLKGAEEREASGDYRQAEVLLSEWELAATASGLDAADEKWGEREILLAEVWRRQARYEKAIKLLDALVERATKQGWTDTAGRSKRVKGRVLQVQGLFEEAYRCHTEGAELAKAAGDTKLLALCRIEMGVVAARMGSLSEGSERIEEALADFVALDDAYGMARSHLCLAIVARQSGGFDQAVEHLAEAQTLFQKLGARGDVATCLNNLGELARLQGRYDEAMQHYREAGEQLKSLGSGDALFPEINLAMTQLDRGDYADAKPVLEWGLEELLRRGMRGIAGAVHICLLECAASEDDWGNWDSHYAQGVSLLGESNLVDIDAARVAERAAVLACKGGQPNRAREAYAIALKQWLALERVDDAERIKEAISAL